MDYEDVITEESLLEGFSFDVLEASLDEGQTRSNEPDADIQSSTIIDRGRHSKYKVQARLKTCIHGVLDAASKIPASLIVVDYSLFNLKEQGRFSSATVTFDFAPHTEDDFDFSEDQKLLSTPSVVAYAPFEKAKRWATTVGQKDEQHAIDVALEPEVPGVGKIGKIGYKNESGGSHEQKYFAQGLAGRHFVNSRDATIPKDAKNIAYHVWWNLQHDFSQTSGVPPQFRTAILVTRPADAAEHKFKAKCNIAVRGGVGMTLSTLTDKFLRRNVPETPIVFNPHNKILGEKLEGLEPNDDGVYELGHLAEGRELVKLSEVWGLDPVLH